MEFKNKYFKRYNNLKTEVVSFRNFMRNHRSINIKHRNQKFVMALNHFADLSLDELKSLYSLKPRQNSSKWRKNIGNLEVESFLESVNIPLIYLKKIYEFDNFIAPSKLNWSEKVSDGPPIRDQGLCGSCWAFGSIGAAEWQHRLIKNSFISFSQQVLIDCSWEYNNGCQGGLQNLAYKWVAQHGGLPTSSSYGPYKGINAYCHYNDSDVTRPITIPAALYINSINDYDINKFVALFGPPTISIKAGIESFIFYSEGIYDDINCSSEAGDADHAVVLEGYGYDENGVEYWLIKNSWSSFWGESGFVRIAKDKHICGVTNDVLIPIIA